MGLNFDQEAGQTILDPDEMDGLLIPTITTRAELDAFEQANIVRAMQWTLTRKLTSKEILSEAFVKGLHRRMYGDVWAWAGQFRKTNKNIGVECHQVAIELRKLIGDCAYWIKHQVYTPDEIAVRFKHRIVQIHCFSNGNGRHSRLVGDIVATRIFERPIFSWGQTIDPQQVRSTYITAVKAADRGDFKMLVDFSRK